MDIKGCIFSVSVIRQQTINATVWSYSENKQNLSCISDAKPCKLHPTWNKRLKHYWWSEFSMRWQAWFSPSHLLKGCSQEPLSWNQTTFLFSSSFGLTSRKTLRVAGYEDYLKKYFHLVREKMAIEWFCWQHTFKLQAAYLRCKLCFTSSYFFIIIILLTFFFSGYKHYLPLCKFLEHNWIATKTPQELCTNQFSIRTVEAFYYFTYLTIICDECNTNIISSSPRFLRPPDQITRTWANTSSCTPDLQQIYSDLLKNLLL